MFVKILRDGAVVPPLHGDSRDTYVLSLLSDIIVPGQGNLTVSLGLGILFPSTFRPEAEIAHDLVSLGLTLGSQEFPSSGAES